MADTPTPERIAANMRAYFAGEKFTAILWDRDVAILLDGLDAQAQQIASLTDAVCAANDMAKAIRVVVWETPIQRHLAGDRTLVGLVKLMAQKWEEARDNRKGEYELRAQAEHRAEAAEAMLADLKAKIQQLPRFTGNSGELVCLTELDAILAQAKL